MWWLNDILHGAKSNFDQMEVYSGYPYLVGL